MARVHVKAESNLHITCTTRDEAAEMSSLAMSGALQIPTKLTYKQFLKHDGVLEVLTLPFLYLPISRDICISLCLLSPPHLYDPLS